MVFVSSFDDQFSFKPFFLNFEDITLKWTSYLEVDKITCLGMLRKMKKLAIESQCMFFIFCQKLPKTGAH